MSDRKEVMKECLNKVLGQYIQNSVDLENLTNYLYKMSVIIFKDTDMSEEYKNMSGFSTIDEEGFKKALRDISMFTSNRIMLEVLGQTYQKIKNTIPMNTVQMDVQKSVQQKRQAQKSASSVAEFDIDLGSIPKVDTSTLYTEQKKQMLRGKKSMSSEFEIGDIDLNAVNKSSLGSEVPMGFSSRTNILTDDSYSDVPSVDIGLDY